MRVRLNKCWGGPFCLALILLWGCAADDPAGSNPSVATSVKTQDRDWKRFIDDCISKVDKSKAVFYRRGEQVNGSQVAQQMRQYLRHILRTKVIPDPYGRNAGVTLAIITTYEGIYFGGLTGEPEPILIEVGGRRMKVYDWLKMEFGVVTLPGEEPGHEVHVATQCETDITPELLAQWEQYIDKCIQAVREAKDVTFLIKEQIWSADEVAVMLEANRSNAIRFLKYPKLKDNYDKKSYRAGSVTIELTQVPLPERDSFANEAQYSKALELWATSDNIVKEPDGSLAFLSTWMRSKAGEPPRMPKLKGK
jgi:hypothetical protein